MPTGRYRSPSLLRVNAYWHRISSLLHRTVCLTEVGYIRGANEMRAVDQLPHVTDRQSFIVFVRRLQAERADPQTRAEWENDTIEAYLEAAAAWAEDAPMQLPPLIDAAAIWQMFAHFLYSGKIYE